ncbi:unnamed protein product [Strongylus vulgaris]|uniref:Uncharacterized protein n=1 Tax=Strongylus vulgaris TaxID=40348 RepID=A0A3P7JQF1_STRVU|nr:unnamed protein product [Strongylus vulgaris]
MGSLNGRIRAEIDQILTKGGAWRSQWCHPSAMSNHRILRAKRKKKFCHLVGGREKAVYDGVRLEVLLTTCDAHRGGSSEGL